MPYWTPHDMRRTFGTRIAQTGATLKTTQDLLGHKDPKTTALIYVVTDDEQKAQAIALMKNRREA